MSRSLVFVVVTILCVFDIGTFALDCLKCHSNDFQSECRLGSRKNRPKIDKCYESGSKCYAVAIVHLNGTAIFERGCSSEPNFCDSQNAEFCETCGFTYCNFVVMELEDDVENFLLDDEAAVLKKRTKRSKI